MRELLFLKGIEGGGTEGRGECCSFQDIILPQALTGQKQECARLLGIVLHACTILCNLGSLGILGSCYLGVPEILLCQQFQERAWLPRLEIA